MLADAVLVPFGRMGMSAVAVSMPCLRVRGWPILFERIGLQAVAGGERKMGGSAEDAALLR